MSYSMGISLNPTYFEAVLVKEAGSKKEGLAKPEHTKRILFPSAHLGVALKDWVDGIEDPAEISKIFIGHHDPSPQINSLFSSLSEQQNSSHAAFLTTLGFESWLEVNHHLSKLHTLLERDLVFGVSERTNARGEVTTKPSEEDIDFLVSKLNLNGIKFVAIGFLHSDLNPSNELLLKEKLTAKGFNVWVSSELNGRVENQPVSVPIKDEKERFLHTFLAAQSSFLIQDWLNKLEEFFPDKKIFQVTEPLFRRSLKFFDNKSLLYAGVDGLYLLPNKENPAIEMTPKFWAPLEKNFFSSLEFNLSPDNLESGPISFGRSTQVTPFDLIHLMGLLDDAPGVSEKIHEKSSLRIKDALRAEAKLLGVNDEELSQRLLSQVHLSWITDLIQLSSYPEVLLLGPMATTVHKLLKKHPTQLKFKVIENGSYSSSLTLIGEKTS